MNGFPGPTFLPCVKGEENSTGFTGLLWTLNERIDIKLEVERTYFISLSPKLQQNFSTLEVSTRMHKETSRKTIEVFYVGRSKGELQPTRNLAYRIHGQYSWKPRRNNTTSIYSLESSWTAKTFFDIFASGCKLKLNNRANIWNLLVISNVSISFIQWDRGGDKWTV